MVRRELTFARFEARVASVPPPTQRVRDLALAAESAREFVRLAVERWLRERAGA